ncbi:MAG: DUF3341 domain-containing protein [Planctomycetota bacterium]|nr:MAG: DUF3341 domain-containing protein [Planctomycetota bacterium]
MAEFRDPEALVDGARRVREAGYRRFDAFSPMPIEGLAEAIGFTRTRMPLVVLIGGLIGAVAGYLLQYWVSVIAYPLNVGGRPLNSWPYFIPVTFETTVLVAALFGVLGMLALNGLPRPHHPLFAVEQFAHATRDGFFLCIETADARFAGDETRRLLVEAGATEVFDVPA